MTGALDGRTAIVTGGGRGIGAATARALDAAGARVAITARSADQLAEVAKTLDNDPVTIVADLGTPDGPQAVADAALTAFDGRLDILVNNAAALLRSDTDTLTVDEIDHLLDVNVRAPLLLVSAVVPAMVASGRGSIVSISSISGLRGTPRRAAYAASKAAVDGLTRSLAMEFGPRGIRANTVAPGVVATEMWVDNLAKPGVPESVLGVTPIRRLINAEEIAAVVVFLASDAASAITGEVISADGGMNSTVNLWPTV
jgi:NAD(P)-dependent dehydrogenase (short-subunit alcohol dehydrogenase family)